MIRRLSVAFLLLAAAPVFAGLADIPRPPLPPFTPAKPVRVVLPNGMVVFLMEDHELPLIQGSILVRGGAVREPADKVGLVGIYGEVWRTGGTTARTGDELDDFLEARGAKVETGGSDDTTSVSWDCLVESFDEVFPVVLDVLQNPAFREDKIALAKRQTETAISRRNDDAAAIARREARKLVYGADSPYARTIEYATLAAIDRDSLLAWHREHLHPNRMIVAVSGDFDAKKMEARLRRTFGSWKKGPAVTAANVPIAKARPGLYFVDKADVNQSNVRVVHVGVRRDDPDFYALEVLNEAFSGGFSSRLFLEIRTKRGLAYSVGGAVGSAYDHAGVTGYSTATKSETTVESIETLRAEIARLQKEGVAAADLARAKDSILNSFVFQFDSKQEILSQQVTYELYGYPADLLDRYRPAIDKVTADDVLRAARKHIRPSEFAVLVVGKSADFGRPLSELGTVTPIDITIPGAPEKR